MEQQTDQLLRSSSEEVKGKGEHQPRRSDSRRQTQSYSGINTELDTTPKIFFLVFALLFVGPLAGVLTSAPRLTRSLGKTGCLPDGSFQVPGTASIWDTDYFLSINVPVSPTSPDGATQWSFARAKAVDVVWDLFIGRGMQIALAFLAFRVFTKVLWRLMEREEMPFRTYAAVAFHPGAFSSSLPPSRRPGLSPSGLGGQSKRGAHGGSLEEIDAGADIAGLDGAADAVYHGSSDDPVRCFWLRVRGVSNHQLLSRSQKAWSITPASTRYGRIAT